MVSLVFVIPLECLYHASLWNGSSLLLSFYVFLYLLLREAGLGALFREVGGVMPVGRPRRVGEMVRCGERRRGDGVNLKQKQYLNFFQNY